MSDIAAELRAFQARAKLKDTVRLQNVLLHADEAGVSSSSNAQIRLVQLSVLPPTLAEHVALLAVTSGSLRIYLGLPRTTLPGTAPASLRIVAVRLPPAGAASIRGGLQLHGTFFTVNEDTSVTAYTRDFLQHNKPDCELFLQPDEQPMLVGQVSRMVTRPYQEQAVVVKDVGGFPVGVYAAMQERRGGETS